MNDDCTHDDHAHASLVPVMDGNVLSWRLVYLAARMEYLVEETESLSNPFLQMRLRGMYEAFAWLMASHDHAPHIESDFPSITEIDGHEIDMDIVGRGISEALLVMLTKTSGKNLGEIMEHEVAVRGCDRDLPAFLAACYDEQTSAAMENFDENILKLLDTNE